MKSVAEILKWGLRVLDYETLRLFGTYFFKGLSQKMESKAVKRQSCSKHFFKYLSFKSIHQLLTFYQQKSYSNFPYFYLKLPGNQSYISQGIKVSISQLSFTFSENFPRFERKTKLIHLDTPSRFLEKPSLSIIPYTVRWGRKYKFINDSSINV